jgi:CheY-like chemotaxis protein
MPKTKPLVLIVDDQPDNLYMYSRYFDDQGSLRVTTAMTGAEAVLKAQRFKPDAILLDLSMPVMSGYEVAKVLSEDPATRAIPIVFVSAYASHAEALAALKGSARTSFVGEVAHGYVSKPCVPQKLLAEIRAVLAEKRSA